MDNQKLILVLNSILWHLNHVQVESETNLNNQLVAIRKTKEAIKIVEEVQNANQNEQGKDDQR